MKYLIPKSIQSILDDRDGDLNKLMEDEKEEDNEVHNEFIEQDPLGALIMKIIYFIKKLIGL